MFYFLITWGYRILKTNEKMSLPEFVKRLKKKKNGKLLSTKWK